jgi:hypothetical protein
MPSLPISKRPEKLVVDANPIISALLGGKAKRLFFEADITVFAVADTAFEEVRRYLPKMAEKLGVSLDFLAYALDLLPLTIYSSRIYRHSLKAEKIQIAHRDRCWPSISQDKQQDRSTGLSVTLKAY